MKTSLIRLIWSVIDETLTRCTVNVSHLEQVQLVLHQVNTRMQLSHQEYAAVKQYLMERQNLIQDLYCEQLM